MRRSQITGNGSLQVKGPQPALDIVLAVTFSAPTPTPSETVAADRQPAARHERQLVRAGRADLDARGRRRCLRPRLGLDGRGPRRAGAAAS